MRMAGQPAPGSTPVSIYICGDSTAAKNQPPILGWGEQLGHFVDSSVATVHNAARGGRSARTFINEGLWKAVQSTLRPGDLVLIQFGHNDSKGGSLNKSRYDLDGTGESKEVAADPKTGAPTEIFTYGHYLRQMIREARAAGANVVVLASVPRSKWLEGKVVLGEEHHVEWAEQVAREESVPFLDVNRRIAEVYNPIGALKIKALYFPKDNTHTNPDGALLNAACIVKSLVGLGLPPVSRLFRSTAAAEADELISKVPAMAAKITPSLTLNGLFPAIGATDVSPDTPVRIEFRASTEIADHGLISIVDASSGKTAGTIDLSKPTDYQTIGGVPGFKYRTVTRDGDSITLHFPNGTLDYGRSYFVTADAGAFRSGPVAYPALVSATGWSFKTRPKPKPFSGGRIIVASDGTGDFCTVQGALDSIPDGNNVPTTIFIKRGVYTELIAFANKSAITILGEDRKASVIQYENNARFNDGGGNPYAKGTNPSAADHKKGGIYHRAVFMAHRTHDLTLENLTVRNTTAHGGSQAEAIILNGTTDARAIVKDVDLYSFQDTLQINGQAYITNAFIEGDVDFLWGNGPSFFSECTFRTVRSDAYFTQIRNPATNHGFVFSHCTFTGADGVTGNFLSRIEPERFPSSEVVLIDCVVTQCLSPVAWVLQGPHAKDAPLEALHFWEYASHDASGHPLDTSRRAPVSRQLRLPEDQSLIDSYSKPAFVLGGWNPLASSASNQGSR